MVKKIISNKYAKVVLVIALILGIGFVGFKYINKSEESSSEAQTQKEERVMRGNITIDFDGDGEAEIPVVNLDFDVSEKLKELYVSEGDEITTGQLLAKLDDTEYVKKLKTAEINYKKAVANLEKTEEDKKLSLLNEKQKLEELKLKLEEIEATYLPMLEIEDVYSPQAIEIKKTSYENAKSAYETQKERYEVLINSNKDIELERANVESAKLSLEMAEDDLESTILTAPTDGTILNIAYKLGETISSVRESGEVTADTTHFMVVSDSDKVEVIVPVSEIDLSKVEIEQNVEVEFEAFEGEKFSGKVVSIDALPIIDNSGLVTFDVGIELEGGVEKIRSGMTCSASFIVRQKKDVNYISNKAVSIVDGKQVVKVKDENGNIEIKTIITGLTDGKYVEVIEGLNLGETIIIEEKKVE
ncbi:efflux RND transporter periplasmic adaptor subunit [Wukongibacter baidiensis]|uniref:efflux RND transporter periplasmic adaptor subunit n=1 Tax=Wukongibacter baidiensis TaxID=1723361 RepID=UPI003D7FF94D